MHRFRDDPTALCRHQVGPSMRLCQESLGVVRWPFEPRPSVTASIRWLHSNECGAIKHFLTSCVKVKVRGRVAFPRFSRAIKILRENLPCLLVEKDSTICCSFTVGSTVLFGNCARSCWSFGTIKGCDSRRDHCYGG